MVSHPFQLEKEDSLASMEFKTREEHFNSIENTLDSLKLFSFVQKIYIFGLFGNKL